MEHLYGIYRGIVADVDDPQLRGRVRVFVYGVNRAMAGYVSGSQWFLNVPNTTSPAIDAFSPQLSLMHDGGSSSPFSGGSSGSSGTGPMNTLPWAEIISPAGRHKGDFPRYSIGDRVCVMFENGHSTYPFIIGSWVSGNNMRIGDLYPEQRASTPSSQGSGYGALNYPDSFKAMLRGDDNANALLMQSLAHERKTELRAGFGSMTINGNDYFIETRTPNYWKVMCGVGMIDATVLASLSAPNILIQTPFGVGAAGVGSTQLMNGTGAGLINIQAGGVLEMNAALTRIGYHVNQIASGTGSSGLIQGYQVNLFPSENVVIGGINVSGIGGGGSFSTQNILLNAMQNIIATCGTSSSGGLFQLFGGGLQFNGGPVPQLCKLWPSSGGVGDGQNPSDWVYTAYTLSHPDPAVLLFLWMNAGTPTEFPQFTNILGTNLTPLIGRAPGALGFAQWGIGGFLNGFSLLYAWEFPGVRLC